MHASRRTKPETIRGTRRRWLYGLAIGTGVLLVLFGSTAFVQMAEGMARRNLQRNHYDQALQWLQRAGGPSTNRPETLFLLARTQRKLENFDEAVKLLDRAESCGLNASVAQRERWLMQVQTGQLRDIEERLGTLLKDPQGDESEICEAFVRGYRAAKRFQRASDILAAWQADFPSASQPYFLRGLLWQDAGFLDLAEKEFRRACELQSDHAEAALALAAVLQERQALESALQNYQRVLADKPQELRALLGTARCLRQLGQGQAARANLDKIPEENAGPEVALERGTLEFATGNYERAVFWLKSAYANAPNQIQVRRQIALALAATGQKEDANEHFEFLNLAHRHHNQIKELSARVFADARDTGSRVAIAKLLLEMGSDEEAIRWLYGALELDPHLTSAHRLLVEFYERNQAKNPAYAAFARRHRASLQSSQQNSP